MIRAFGQIISDVEKEAIENLCDIMTEEQCLLVAKYGADMYQAGWLDWCGPFFIAGGVTGAAVTLLMVWQVDRKKKRKNS